MSSKQFRSNHAARARRRHEQRTTPAKPKSDAEVGSGIGLEIILVKEPVVVSAAESKKRSAVKLPVAPAKRPVPPGMVAVSTMLKLLGFAIVGVALPVKSARSKFAGRMAKKLSL
jgi:hypothetical protein